MGCCTSAPKPPIAAGETGKAPAPFHDNDRPTIDESQKQVNNNNNENTRVNDAVSATPAASVSSKNNNNDEAVQQQTKTETENVRVMSREGIQQTHPKPQEGSVHKRVKSEDIAENSTILGRISQHKKVHFFHPNFTSDPIRILTYLDDYDLARLTQVNKQLHGLVEGFISIRHAKHEARPDWTESDWCSLKLGSRGAATQWNKLKRRLAKEPNLNIKEELAEDISAAAFREKYEAKGQPVLIRGCAQDWRAFASTTVWTFDALASRFPNTLFRFNDLHGEEILLKDYLLYARSTDDDSPLGLYDSQLGVELGDPRTALLSEYKVPTCFPEDLFSMIPPAERPPYRWILLGTPRSGTEMHVDPLETSAWVTVLSGRKKWCLFPPNTDDRTLGGVHALTRVEEDATNPVQDSVTGGIKAGKNGKKAYAPTACEWYRSYWHTPAVKNVEGVVSVTQGPGDTVFVPGGWKHIVLNLEETVAITHNYAPKENLDKIRKCVKATEPEFYAKWEAKLKEKGLI